MRRLLKRHLPTPESLADHRWLACFGTTLLHPRLWHLNRHSAAGAVAVGLFCGLIPGPFQMLGAAVCCVMFRVNLPLALFTTLYTNPFTIVPLYLAAFTLGQWLLGPDDRAFVAPPDFHDGLTIWFSQLAHWAADLGQPLVLGLIALASLLAGAGYALTRLIWRLHLVRAWRRRKGLT